MQSLTMINIIIYYLIVLKQLLLIIYFIWRMPVIFFHSFKPLCSCRTLASCSLSAYYTSVSIFSTLICLQGHNRLFHITIYIHIHIFIIIKLRLTIITYTKLTFLLLRNLQVCLLGQTSIQWLLHTGTQGMLYTPIHNSFFNLRA